MKRTNIRKGMDHGPAIIGLIGISVIFSIPHVVIPLRLPPGTYDPLSFIGGSMAMEEVYTYVPEVQEILEGKRWVSDTQLAEYKNKPSPYVGETLPSYIMAALARVFGSMGGAFVAADTLFPAITAAIIYWGIVRLTLQRALSFLSAVVVVLFAKLAALLPYPALAWRYLFVALPSNDFLFFSRNFHPQISFPLYLLAVLAIGKLVSTPSKKSVVIAGILMGLQWYTYLFSWISVVLGTAILLCILALGGRKRQLGALFAAGMIAVVVAGGYLSAAYRYRSSPAGQDFFFRSSTSPHAFATLIARYIAALIVFVLIWNRIGTKRSVRDVVASYWAAPIFLPSLSQAFLGRNLEGDHWISRFAMPWTVIGLLLAIGMVGLRISRIRRIVGIMSVLLIVILMVAAARIQSAQSNRVADRFRRDPAQTRLYQWMNQNTPVDSVVASLNWTTVGTLPALTHDNNYAPIGIRSIAPTGEIIDRYLWTAALLGAPESFVQYEFSKDNVGDWEEKLQENAGAGLARTAYFTYSTPDNLFPAPPEVTQQILKRFREIEALRDAGSTPPFRLDYVLVTPFEQKILTKFPESRHLASVYSDGKYELWRIW